MKSKDTKLSRHALTASSDNDMNKSRYVMKVLSRSAGAATVTVRCGEPADGQATAEHITPVNPSGSTVRNPCRIWLRVKMAW